MVEVVINFDKEKNLYKAYEPTTDTIFMTASLGETFLRLEEHLKKFGLIADSILSDQNITYHIDSPTFIAMVKSNAALLKRLDNSPTSFMVSSQKLGVSNYKKDKKKENFSDSSKKRKTGNFSKSNFNSSNKKFWGK